MIKNIVVKSSITLFIIFAAVLAKETRKELANRQLPQE